jgi:hypothetical protein
MRGSPHDLVTSQWPHLLKLSLWVLGSNMNFGRDIQTMIKW